MCVHLVERLLTFDMLTNSSGFTIKISSIDFKTFFHILSKLFKASIEA
ncbi:MAG: hypothetical protein RLZ54_566 [Candidatus Parcubacteria bacterium]